MNTAEQSSYHGYSPQKAVRKHKQDRMEHRLHPEMYAHLPSASAHTLPPDKTLQQLVPDNGFPYEQQDIYFHSRRYLPQ